MIRRPPRSTPFPYPPLFRSPFRTAPSVEHVVDASSDRSLRRTRPRDRKSTRLNSSHSQISYAVFCLKTKPFGLRFELFEVGSFNPQRGIEPIPLSLVEVHYS